MLISFIGSPLSCKTTIAVNVFSYLKNNACSCELIVEQARLHIARKRYVSNGKQIKLTDYDQKEIMQKQLEIEKIFKHICPEETIIISDSSSLNSLLYMSEECRNDFKVKTYVDEAIKLYDLVFYLPPFTNLGNVPDTNRVHTLKESLEIDKDIPNIFSNHVPSLHYIPLNTGSNENKVQKVLREINNRL